jgi:slime mold repeat-containing protein
MNPVVCTALDQCHVGGVCDPANGTCSNPEKPNGSACNDGDACTQTDTCQAGSCAGTNPVVCAALDQCHVAGVCDPASGTCSNPNQANGVACDDGLFCTVNDTCTAGVCGGAARDCSAADDACNTGVCREASDRCDPAPRPNGTVCDDGDACTQTDTCRAGVCHGRNPVVCEALDQCHEAGVCDPATGTCSNPDKANGSACVDGDACTQTDTCQAGVCTGMNPVVCTALDQCHDAGVCDPASGTCSNPDKANGSACNDGDACTRTDTCQAGACTGMNPVVCTALDQCHDAGVCDPASGTCSNPDKPNGSACSDSDACTQTDTCQAGGCVGANPVVCAALDQCHVAGVCDPASGACSNPTAADGGACSDGDACTQTDACQAGACIGTNPVVCEALDQCHVAGICDPASGTCSNPNQADGAACNDGDACTRSDTCQAGICTGTNPVVCAALDQCHVAGVCDPATGICSNPDEADGTTCDDGQFCTVNDTCTAGVCGGSSRDCSALGDQCNDGTCNETADRCEPTPKVDGTACSDGSLCTSNDTCQAGVCGGTSLVCDDGDPCTTDSCDPTAGCTVQPVTGLGAATCLLIPQASCQPLPPAIVKAIARAQTRIASAGATSNHHRAKKLLVRASHGLKRAAKKTHKLAKKGRISPACAGVLSRNLLDASSRVLQLRKTL